MPLVLPLGAAFRRTVVAHVRVLAAVLACCSILRAFIIEEQKIVKQVLLEQLRKRNRA